MHYLQGHFDYALGKIVTHIVPNHRYISVHDLFNPQLFHRCLLASINQIPELASACESLSLPTMMKQGDSAIQGGYIEQRMHNFTIICEVMSQAFDLLGLNAVKTAKETLFRMVKHCDLDELQSLLEQLFQLIIRNHDILEFITTLGEEQQFIIKDFLQRARSKQEVQLHEEAQQDEHEDEKRRLQEENGELRSLLAGKEGELDQAQHHIHDLEDQLAELREMEMVKEANIEGLKRRLIAYQETDALFQEKDEEIFKLQGQLGELQIANRLLSTQLKSQREKLEGKVSELQRNNTELQIKCDRLVNNYELMSRQREDSEASNKRVITNLRDKIKALNQRVSELQGQLVQAKIGRQLRQREFTELMTSFQSLKSQSSDMCHRPRQQSLDRILVNSSSGHGKEFLRLEQELNQIDKLKENAFEEEIMMFDSGQDNVKKVQEIIAENARLKERLASQESRGGKELLDQNQRLRKRCAILKRKADEVQSTHRQQMNLMVSAFDGLLHRE